jgi:hypothetical protein
MNGRRLHPIVVLVVLLCISLGCAPFELLISGGATEQPVGEPTQEIPTTGGIEGIVWKDICEAPEGGVAPIMTLPPGCAGYGASNTRGNGQREAGEPGIAGVIISIGGGECYAAVLASVQTDSQGAFQFSGLAPGQYSLWIDPSVGNNVQILGFGVWTHPEVTEGAICIPWIVGPGEPQRSADFAWSYW